jgi:HlyD family secretion protein
LKAKEMKIDSVHDRPWNDFDWRKLFRNIKLWILVAALAVVSAGGYLAYQRFFTSQQETTESSQVQTAVARIGDLTVFASGAGEVVAASEVGVGFDQSGTLAEVLVSQGDKVQAGQVLARLQTDRSEQDIALSLAEAQLDVLTAQQDLDDLHASAEMDAAQALVAVEEAQNDLDDLNNPQLQQAQALQDVAEAQEALKQAQASYNGTRSTADENTIAAAKAELTLAEKKLKDQQAKFKGYANKPDNDLDKANQQLKLSQAQGAYDDALRYYNAVTSTGSDLYLELTQADLATAEANLAEAQKEYERVKDGPTPGEIALAEATLAQAQANYEVLKNGPDPAKIALAEANLANAKAQLAVAQEDQAVIDLEAPMDGTVMSIDASLGEEIGTGSIITLANLSQPILEVYLDESDLNNVAVGMDAEVVFDSLPDTTFTGQVTEVNPSLVTVGNVDTVMAKVKLDVDSFAKPQTLPVGSNASVDIIGGRAQNVVLVPVEAVREISSGEYAVFVMQDGEPRLRVVAVGLMDYTSAEITSGLEAGEVVTTGMVQTGQ